jgi:cell division protein FtsB
MKHSRFALHLLSRVTVVIIVGAFITLAGVQYARIIDKNLMMADQLATAQNDVRRLQAKRDEQDRRIHRLSDPAGAIPEIHDELHLVRDGEAIIYLKGHGDGP